MSKLDSSCRGNREERQRTGQAIHISVAQFSGEEENGAEEQTEEDWAAEIGIIHYALIDVSERVQHGKSLELSVIQYCTGETRGLTFI